MPGRATGAHETLADFGTVSTFNYDTFTTAIYKMWFGFFPGRSSSARLFLVLIALVLLVAEQSQRRRRLPSGRSGQTGGGLCSTGWHRWLASGYCALVLALSFLLPVAQLALWATESFGEEFDERYYAWLGHSLLLGLLASLLVAAVALALVYAAAVTGIL
ncbi:MAG: hypothetical protein R2864_05230 [Syntrophotaleaceae bacterium]